MTGTQRDGAPPIQGQYVLVCHRLAVVNKQVGALTVYPADLRERECLDTRDVYQNQDGFRSSQARSA
jgi:hypothetical protein